MALIKQAGVESTRCMFCGRDGAEEHEAHCPVPGLVTLQESIVTGLNAAAPYAEQFGREIEAIARQMGHEIVAGVAKGIDPQVIADLSLSVRQFIRVIKIIEKESRQNFEELVKALRKAGYRVKVKWVTEWVLKRGRRVNRRIPKMRWAEVRGKNIRAIFATAGASVGEGDEDWTSVDHRFDGHLVAENARCFDRWSKAPMIIELPRDPAEVLEWLAFLGSEPGFTISNEYLYLERNPFPNQFDQKVGERPQVSESRMGKEPVLLHGLGDGLRARLLPRVEIEEALVEMGVEGGYAAATELQLVQARLNAVLRWNQEELS